MRNEKMHRKNFKNDCQIDYNCTVFYRSQMHSYNFSRFDAIAVVGRSSFSILESHWLSHPWYRSPNQIWLAVSLESSNHLETVSKHHNFNSAFNWTGALSRKATLERSYTNFYRRSEPVRLRDVSAELDTWNKTLPFCWMVSNCRSAPSGRMQIVSELIKYLKYPLHMWGKAANICMSNDLKGKIINHGAVPNSKGNLAGDLLRQDTIKQCKVYFALENSICTDYISEKFSNALMTFSVPLVLGFRSSYDRKMPGSFIHLNDFKNISMLAEHLHDLVESKDRLLKYHEWRKEFYISDAKRNESFECQFCRKVYEARLNQKPLVIPDLKQTFRKIQTCA